MDGRSFAQTTNPTTELKQRHRPVNEKQTEPF
jgi:hypothetical protein